jgi:hypothetical protein
MDYQGNDKLGPYMRCKCGYADFDTHWGDICKNCGSVKEPKKDK